MSEQRHYRGGLVWPIILLGAGIVLLLNNLGRLPWGIWESLFRLWPVLLIAIGLDILVGRRSALGSLFVALLLLAVLAAAIWIGMPQWGGAEMLTTETIRQPLDGAQQAQVEITFGSGALNIKAAEESASLVEGRVMLSQNERLAQEFSKSGDTAHYQLGSEGAWQRWSGSTASSEKTWDLAFNPDVALQLQIRTGVGRSTLDLSGLKVTELDVNGGVGQVVLNLPRRGQLNASIEGGVGQVIVTVPRGVAAQIRTQGGLGNVSVTGSFSRSGDTYTSANFSTAADRVSLKIQGGVGQVVVRQGD